MTEEAKAAAREAAENLAAALVKLSDLAALATAVEGYRNQLSVFADTALAEIAIIKEWIAAAIADIKKKP